MPLKSKYSIEDIRILAKLKKGRCLSKGIHPMNAGEPLLGNNDFQMDNPFHCLILLLIKGTAVT